MEDGDVALSSLRPRYHVLMFTVDVSQWRGAHSFWPCSVNILEHSGGSSGSPGALYLNNIISCIDILILILIVIRLSGVGSRGEQLKQGAPDFPFPGHIDQL